MIISQRYILNIIVFLISFSGITRVFFNTQTPATTLSMLLNYLSIFLVIFLLRRNPLEVLYKQKLLYAYLVYGIIILIYSFFVTTSYEQSRYVFTVFLPSITLPLFGILSSKLDFVHILIRGLLIISLPLSFFKYFSNLEGMSDFTHYVSFIYFLLLLTPYLKKKWRIIIYVISVLSFFYSLESRSNILNLSFVALMLIIFFFKKDILNKLTRKIRLVFLYVPIVFVFLAFLGINIFTIMDEFKDQYVVESEDNKQMSLVNDSRTGVYLDAWRGVAKENAYLYGISAAGYHHTFLSEIMNEDFKKGLSKGRLGSEVGILEYWLRGGLIFVIIIVLIHYHASKIAIYNSNNLLSKLLGLYISFRLFFLFIESQVDFNLSNISTFIAIGLCLNPNFRKMSDHNMKIFLKSI